MEREGDGSLVCLRLARNFSTSSRYTAKLMATRRGDWRVRAYHPGDSANAATSCGYRNLVEGVDPLRRIV